MRRFGLFILILIVSLVLLEVRAEYEWNPLSASRVTGQVLDRDTRKPIANAVVISIWETYTVGGRFCFDSDSTTADAQGRYMLPSWEHTWRNAMAMQDKTLKLFAYAPGYISESPVPAAAVSRVHNEDIHLDRSDEARRLAGYLTMVLNEREGCGAVFQGENDVHEDHFKLNRPRMEQDLEELKKRIPEPENTARGRLIIRGPRSVEPSRSF